MIKIGDKVDIFQKPLTNEDFEGKAIVKAIDQVYENHIDATVEFLSDPGDLFFRAILTDD